MEIEGENIPSRCKGTTVMSSACLKSRKVNSITGGRLVKGRVEEEIREAQGVEGERREPFSTYCHKGQCIPAALNFWGPAGV